MSNLNDNSGKRPDDALCQEKLFRFQTGSLEGCFPMSEFFF